MLRPLLSVCHGLRAIALSRYCNLCKLELASSYTYKVACSLDIGRISYVGRPYPYDFGYSLINDLGHPTYHLAKELIIELDEGAIYSGALLGTLTRAPYEGCAFPLVRKLILRIFMDMTDDDYKEELSKRALRSKGHSVTWPINTYRPDALYDSVDEEDEDDKVSDSGEDADSDVNAGADSNADAGLDSDAGSGSGSDPDEDADTDTDKDADSDEGVDAVSNEDENFDSGPDEETNTDKDSDEDTNADSDENADTDSDEDEDDPFVSLADFCAFMQGENQMAPRIVEGDKYVKGDSDEDDDYDMIRPNLNKTTDPYVLRANITAFVQWIKQMAPLVDDIDVRPRPYLLYERCTDLYGSLVTQLFQLSKQVTYNDRELFPVPLKLQPNQICDLEEIGDFVHLCFSAGSNQSPFIELAQRSAQTLRSLRIGHSSYSGLGNYILDTKGGYVSYPRLLTLCLVRMDNVDSAEYPTLPGAVPFPNLRRLHVYITYPFTDDTLFRGNAATLEHLKMRMDYHSYNAVSKHNVFTPGSHPKLRCVDVSFSYDMRINRGATIADRLKYILRIGSGATVRTIDGPMDSDDLMQALLVFESFACIRVLSLPHIRLNFWDTISLIGSLPLLSDLITSPPLIEDMSGDFISENRPKFVISEFAKLSEKFRCWMFVQKGLVGDIKNVWAILLLALVCPNFDCAAPVFAERKEFMEQMEATIAIDCFQEYAPRLRRLLYSSWDGKQD
ncbi:hypothetical protein FBU31_003377 [Coemansia sp. 'formosensis']|nr:hypothetical protein FBU31_003377 [Coemansia sp. 'formosensis']